MTDVPITIDFSVDNTLYMDFTEDMNVNLDMEFKVIYRRATSYPLFIDGTGDKRLGDSIANNLL